MTNAKAAQCQPVGVVKKRKDLKDVLAVEFFKEVPVLHTSAYSHRRLSALARGAEEKIK
jgi:hypothetical protein